MGRRGVRFCKQKDSMQCGIASLSMVCSGFGKRVEARTLERVCHASREGVSLKAISDTASAIGLDNAAVRLTIDELRQVQTPAILHWNQNHFVVLCRTKRSDRFVIADPGKGIYTCRRSELQSHWLADTDTARRETGIAMLFEPTEAFASFNPETESNRRSLALIFIYLKEYRRYFVHIAAGLALACVLQLILPFLTQAVVDVGIHRGDIGFIWLILLGELMIVCGRMATDFVRRWMLLHISMRINVSLVSDFLIKLLSLPMVFFDSKLLGDLLQRISDHSRVQNFLTQQVLSVAFTLLSFLVFGVVLLIYNPLIFGVFVASGVIYGLWTASLMRRRKVIDYERFEQQGRAQSLTYRIINAMQEIKLQGCSRRRTDEWHDVQADLFDVELRAQKLQQTQEAGAVFINETKNILITVLAAAAVIDGKMTLGAMLAVQYIIGQLNSPLDQLMGFLTAMQDVKLSLERINEVHLSKGENAGRPCCRSYADPADGITLSDAVFRYDIHSPRNIIKGVSLSIPRGKMTAIVGASGSGKTTLLKLMLGYYPLCSGTLTIGGRQIESYDADWWRTRCGVVMQNGVIFTESIARNIAVTDGLIDLRQLEQAARMANIHDFVMGLPLGYDTIVGDDGVGLSQGQQQRLLIARAIYRDPEFIFLDEATNSLDASNEREIVQNLDDFYRGRTVVVVAHRLSTVRNADNIVVLSDGRIAETGTHAELVERRGPYYNLIKDQLELGQ